MCWQRVTVNYLKVWDTSWQKVFPDHQIFPQLWMLGWDVTVLRCIGARWFCWICGLNIIIMKWSKIWGKINSSQFPQTKEASVALDCPYKCLFLSCFTFSFSTAVLQSEKWFRENNKYLAVRHVGDEPPLSGRLATNRVLIFPALRTVIMPTLQGAARC